MLRHLYDKDSSFEQVLKYIWCPLSLTVNDRFEPKAVSFQVTAQPLWCQWFSVRLVLRESIINGVVPNDQILSSSQPLGAAYQVLQILPLIVSVGFQIEASDRSNMG